MYVKSIYITALLCFPQKPCTQVDAMIAASGHKVKYRAGLPDFVLVQYGAIYQLWKIYIK
jgi:hypothetical protein